jgi:hypothetical protein
MLPNRPCLKCSRINQGTVLYGAYYRGDKVRWNVSNIMNSRQTLRCAWGERNSKLGIAM